MPSKIYFIETNTTQRICHCGKIVRKGNKIGIVMPRNGERIYYCLACAKKIFKKIGVKL